MPSEGDSSGKCRDARRRRIQIRRLLSAGEADLPQSARRNARNRGTAGETPDPPETAPRQRQKRIAGDDDEDGARGSLSPPRSPSSAAPPSSSSGKAVASTSRSVPAVADSPVAFGYVSISGRLREMEDAVSIRPCFFRPQGSTPLHFFAVFDGHGGSHVAALCQELLHVLLSEELARAEDAASPAEKDVRMRAAVGRGFARMDELALTACACGKADLRLSPCGCERPEIKSNFVGSTAVVALIDGGRLVVANCGDSRAVLSRGGRATPLSADHKSPGTRRVFSVGHVEGRKACGDSIRAVTFSLQPNRADELARIKAAGGRVIDLNGARVYGMLAVSRALGDKYLKQYVISEPEIIVVERTAEDECLIIASDGLWDVLPNDLACDMARRSLQDADPTSSGDEDGDARCSLAAALLARLALARRSGDNISVVVVDLRRTDRKRER